MKTNHEAGGEEEPRAYRFDTEVVKDGEDASLEDEFAALRDILASFVAVGTATESFGNRGSNLTGLEDTSFTEEYNKTAIVSDAIRYIRYFEQQERLLSKENTSLEAW